MDEVVLAWFVLNATALLPLLYAVKNTSSSKISRRYGVVAAVLISLGAIVRIVNNPTELVDWLAILLGAYWVLSTLRLWSNRYSNHQLQSLVQRSSLGFFSTVIGLIILEQLIKYMRQNNFDYSWLLLPVYLVILGISLRSLFNVFSRYQKRAAIKTQSSKIKPQTDLPTVTLAIPARNEGKALTKSLEGAIKSKYPKLEIIVLDDCSIDTTPKIVKHFAHKGVRFIEGIKPGVKWLGKNNAYQRLVEESSGEYIIFCGADVRLAPQAVDYLMNQVINDQLVMLSVVPNRNQVNPIASILQPMRHFWAVAHPNILRRFPPVISSCWVISRQKMLEYGGMGAVTNSVLPEAYFARRAESEDAYSFIVSFRTMGISTRKDAYDQYDTAVRTLYPLIHRSMFFAFIKTITIGLFFVLPFFGLIALFLNGYSLENVLLAATAITLLISNFLVSIMITPSSWWVTWLSFPLAVLTEATMLFWSAYRYEFGEVSWKSRDICYPVLQQAQTPTSKSG